MFNLSRRGASSILKVLRAASTQARLPSSRPSALCLSSQNISRPKLEARWLSISSQLRQEAAARQAAPEAASPSEYVHREVTKFQELVDYQMVHPNVINEITQKMGHQTMTEVQTATINQGLQGTDIIAQARTGTGKTLGFLVPTIQNIIRNDPKLATRKRYSRARASDIRAIIISPTRELAEQIAVEAEKLCYNTDLRVQVATGGNSKRSMLMKTQREGCHLLVATPGRLADLLQDPHSGISAPDLTTLVLDEADRLLDDGFSKEVEEIIRMLPPRDKVDRQTLLFSATIPREVMYLVQRTLKPDFHFVQTVKEGELATHQKVPQNVVITPGMENWMPALLELAKREMAAFASGEGKPFKAIVYFSATAQVHLAHEIFRELKSDAGSTFSKHPLWPAGIYIMHGKLTQEARTRAAGRFRNCESGILFSTDVTARGMDFPNVTHVIQIGLPPNQEQYIHRVGRTGRGDKTGEGYIFIADSSFDDARRLLRDLPLKENTTLETAAVDMTKDAQLPAHAAETLSQVAAATKMVRKSTKEDAYLGGLGQLRGGRHLAAQVLTMARWTKYGWGFENPPPVSPTTANKLGISRLPGVNIGRREREPDDDNLFGGRLGELGGGSQGFGFGRSPTGDGSGRSNWGSGRSGQSNGLDSGAAGRISGPGGRRNGYEADQAQRFANRGQRFGDRGGSRGRYSGDRGGGRGNSFADRYDGAKGANDRW